MGRHNSFMWFLALFLVATGAVAGSLDDELREAKTAILHHQTAKAVKIWKRLANNGSAEAQYQLGMQYLRGQGVEKDESRAKYWLLESAQQDYPKSQYALACQLETESSRFYDLEKARFWFKKAADQGHKPSSRRLKSWQKRHMQTGVKAAEKRLFSAVRRNELRRVKDWLSHYPKQLNTLNAGGKTALMMAASLGHKAVVAELLKAGADTAITDSKGNTALLLALQAGHRDIARQLIREGRHLNQSNDSGMFALLIAARKNFTDVVADLLKQGASVNQKNQAGKTAIDIARAAGNKKTVSLLKKAGARFSGLKVTDALAQIDNDYTASSKAFRNWPALHIAAWRQKPNEVKRLLRQKHDVNALDPAGMTALQRAVMQGNDKIARLLIDAGADVNHQAKSGKTAIVFAAATGSLPLVKLLIEQGAVIDNAKDIKKSPFYAAMKNSHETVAIQLLKYQKVNRQQANALLKMASRQKMLSMLEVLLVRYQFSNTLLEKTMLTAIDNHDLKMVRLLIDKGLSVDSLHKGKSFFQHAVDSNSLEMTRLLVDAGASVNKKTDSRLLTLVAAKGNSELFRYLLDLGLEPGIRDELRNTPLMLAAARGHKSIVELLLALDVDTRTRNRDGDTAEELASRAGFDDIASNISKASSGTSFWGGF